MENSSFSYVFGEDALFCVALGAGRVHEATIMTRRNKVALTNDFISKDTAPFPPCGHPFPVKGQGGSLYFQSRVLVLFIDL